MNPKCETCGGAGCYACQGTGEYTGQWKHIRQMLQNEWPGMRAAILYAAVEAIPQKLIHLPWAEFGVWFGNSARYLHRLMPEDVELHLYDSFEGLPEDWEGHPEYTKGTFATGKTQLMLPMDQRTYIHKGWFKDTLAPAKAFGFVHIDSDLYSSAKTILERISPTPGMIIVFDEFYGGENIALAESGITTKKLYETEDGQVVMQVTQERHV